MTPRSMTIRRKPTSHALLSLIEVGFNNHNEQTVLIVTAFLQLLYSIFVEDFVVR